MPPAKRVRRAKKGKGKRRAPRQNYLNQVEIVPSQTMNLNTPYIQIKAGITGARASSMATLFGEYRIKKISYTIRPWYDTYSSGIAAPGNNAVAVPTLYWRLNRYGDCPAAFAGNYMRALGAKPIRMDDKQITWSYTPNVILSQQNVAAASTASIKMSPWLSTDNLVQDNAFTLSTAEHFGCTMFIEAPQNGVGSPPVAYLDCKVYYEFRNPRLNVAPADLDLSGNEIRPNPLVVNRV